jgi:hypothetical protein
VATQLLLGWTLGAQLCVALSAIRWLQLRRRHMLFLI